MSISAMDPAMLADTHPNLRDAMLLRRWQSRGSAVEDECGLSEIESSPSSVHATPDSFVVTPEGKALPAMHHLFADRDGSLHMVDLPLRLERSADSPTFREVACRRSHKFSPFLSVPEDEVDVRAEPAPPTLHLKWRSVPLLRWHKQYKDEECVDRKTATVIEVDEDGTAHVHTMKAREFRKKVREVVPDEQEYVVGPDGVAHLAHKVFIDAGGCTQVLIREDDACRGHGVYDELPTPEVMFNPKAEVIFIAGAAGPAYFGTPVFVSCYDAATGRPSVRVLNRVTPFPDFRAEAKFLKALPYTAPKLLKCNSSKYPSVSDRIDIITADGSVLATYKRVLYARGNSVVVGYRTHNPSDLAVVSETGEGVRCVHMQRPPKYTETQDMVIIACDRHRMNFKGVNVMIPNATSMAFTPVARLADFSDFDAPTMKAVGRAGFATVPGATPVAGLTHSPLLLTGKPAPLLLTAKPKAVYYPPTDTKNCVRVFVCGERDVMFQTAMPRPSEVYEGVVVCRPDGVALRGHTVITMAPRQPNLPAWVGVRSRMQCVPDKDEA